jgi:3'-5' exoribonuclease 1
VHSFAILALCYNLGPTLSGQYLFLPRLATPLLACCHATITMTYVTPPFSIQWPNTSLGNREMPLPSIHSQRPAMTVPQPYDYFLVLDVEATCFSGTGFHWPNEIIEWPVCLLKWVDKGSNGMAGTLQKVAEFRSFVRPTWRPKLSPFCTSLTGITQVSALRLHNYYYQPI